MATMARMLTLPEAIAHYEGFGITPFNRPTRLNNPGDLEFAHWNAAAPYHATLEQTQPTVRARFAHFPTAAQGWAALKALLLSAEYRDLTIAEMVNKYAPGIENDVANYIRYITAHCGCKATDKVIDVMTGAA